MLPTSVFFICVNFFVVLNRVANVNGRVLAKPCQVRLTCPEHEDVVFASEGETCHVFMNSCELRNENCVRHNFYFKTLMPTEKGKCQKLCTEICSKETDVVCAERNNETREFESYCRWSYHVCSSGEMWKSPTAGKCPVKPIES